MICFHEFHLYSALLAWYPQLYSFSLKSIIYALQILILKFGKYNTTSQQWIHNFKLRTSLPGSTIEWNYYSRRSMKLEKCAVRFLSLTALLIMLASLLASLSLSLCYVLAMQLFRMRQNTPHKHSPPPFSLSALIKSTSELHKSCPSSH